MAEGDCAPVIEAARYDGPTIRYAHGVLGDAVEWGVLELRAKAAAGCAKSASTIRATLPRELVFEDVAPRLADLDGDGSPEVITVEASLTKGARLSIWGMRDGQLERLAMTPHIGRRHRWLAPVGAADLDGDGLIEIAYVDRPHLRKRLRIWRYRDGMLEEIAGFDGGSNHKIGWDFIAGGIRHCGAVPEMILADGGFRHLLALRFNGQVVAPEIIGRYSGPQSLDAALSCPR
jgi:hypothetical protein